MTVGFFCLFLHFSLFFFNDTATTEIYTLSLHDALPISMNSDSGRSAAYCASANESPRSSRSEEHTSELQSLAYLVCRLLLENNTHIGLFATPCNYAMGSVRARKLRNAS